MQKFDRIQLNVFHFICFIITVVAHQFDNYDVIEHGNHVITFSTRSAHQNMNQLNLCKNWHDIYIQYLIFCITLYMVNVFFLCDRDFIFRVSCVKCALRSDDHALAARMKIVNCTAPQQDKGTRGFVCSVFTLEKESLDSIRVKSQRMVKVSP